MSIIWLYKISNMEITPRFQSLSYTFVKTLYFSLGWTGVPITIQFTLTKMEKIVFLIIISSLLWSVFPVTPPSASLTAELHKRKEN